MAAQHGHEDEHAHPQPAEYAKIAVILTIVTALEVALYYQGEHTLGQAATTTAILLLSTLKFAMVVMWYMHLKFDPKLFSYFLVGGLALAGAVLVALLGLLPIIERGPDVF
jgi:caa(3)-type oxidase subunit IV